MAQIQIKIVDPMWCSTRIRLYKNDALTCKPYVILDQAVDWMKDLYKKLPKALKVWTTRLSFHGFILNETLWILYTITLLCNALDTMLPVVVRIRICHISLLEVQRNTATKTFCIIEDYRTIFRGVAKSLDESVCTLYGIFSFFNYDRPLHFMVAIGHNVTFCVPNVPCHFDLQHFQCRDYLHFVEDIFPR